MKVCVEARRGHALVSRCCALALSGLLVACAGAEAFRDGTALVAQGQAERGLVRLEEAVRLEPRNIEYRMALMTQRAALASTAATVAAQARAQARQEAVAAAAAAETATTAQRRDQPADIEPRLDARQRRPISLEFSDAPLKSVLDVMSRQAGINVYYDREVRPDIRVTIFARNTTVEDALRLALATNQLEYKVLNGHSVLVYPASAQKIKQYQALAVRSFYLANADVKSVANTLKAIVKARDLVIDERLGLIFMRDTPQALRLAERIIALQDLGDPEVMLEVEILEVRRARLLELGVQWPAQLSLSPLQSGTTPLTLRELGRITSATTQARVGEMAITASKNDGDVKLLANPRIRVRNRERARIQIGERLPIMTTTATSNGFLSESVNYLDVGLKLEVEPDARPNDEVAIRINLEVSSKGQQVMSKNGTNAYQIGTRSASTSLRLQDGETQVLAGLIQDSDRQNASKIPLLGDIPLLGRLFGFQRDDKERTEILLSITPRILRAPVRPGGGGVHLPAGTENNVGGDGLLLSTPGEEAGPMKDLPGLVPTMPADVAPQSRAAPAMPPLATSSGLAFQWQMPASAKVGERFSAVLRMASAGALRDLEARIAFDPQVLRVVSVHEGDFFSQGQAPTRFRQRISAQQGRVFLTVERPDDDGRGLASGQGDFVVLAFEALRASAASKIELLAARPEPQVRGSTDFPLAASLKVAP